MKIIRIFARDIIKHTIRMNIIGRQKECADLQRYMDSDHSEFIAIYGRRRVGKTFLVRQLFGNKMSFSVTGMLEGSPADQKTIFAAALSEYGCDDPFFETWIEAFEKLRKILESQKSNNPLIVFIDELPCFDTQRSGFVNALGHFWNNWAAWRNNVKLIVCGSATSWMTKNLLDSRGGLHNRLTNTMWLKPFSLSESKEYLQKAGFRWTSATIAQCYMVMGGVPYYFSLLDKNKSFAENIDQLFFSKNGELKMEYRRLYGSLFRNPDRYTKVIELLSQKRKGMTRGEISASGVSGRLSVILDDLVQCGFIDCTNVLGAQNKINSRNAIYRLTDFYSIFYMDFCKEKTTDEHYWTHMMGTPKINTWFGLAFERLCMAHIDQIKRSLGISGIHTEYYSWRSKKSQPAAQIDLLIERVDDMINLCEIKYSSGKYLLTKTEFEKIENRQNAFISENNLRKGVFLTLITCNGVVDNEYTSAINNILTIDDLY